MNQKVYGCLSFLILFIATDCFAGGGDKKPKKTPTKFIDKSNMDESIKPGDNFYLYANANWLKSNPVPSIKTRWGSFDVLREESSQRLKKLLEEAAITPVKDRKTQMVGDMYSSAMDSVAIEAAGINPIKPQLDKIASLTDRSAVLAEIATMRTMGLGSPLFRMSVDQDDKNVNQYIPQLSQGGTSLPDRDYYLKNDPRSKKIRDAYKVYLKKLFSLAGENTETAANSADAIMRIETSLAKVQYSRVEMRDPYKTYNKFSVKDFSATTPDMNWENLFSMMQVKGVDSILVDNPGFYKSADVMLSALSLNDWKCYLRWNVLKSSTSYLSSAFVDASFTFNQVISGQKVQTPRWQRTASLIDGSLGEMLGQLYVDKYFKPEAKERMKALVNNLAFAFEDRIKRLDWMSEVTKVKALEKLHSFTKKIGYPDQWKTYDGVTINSKDFLGNLQSTSKWSYQEMVGRMGKPVDRTRWGMTPPTINAYYNPSNNEIVFPAAILQFPFFDFEADDAINYGGIGGVIGHEMTHGFDDQGRQYAADGNL